MQFLKSLSLICFALRKPLVIVGGQIEQLQAGDTLDASVSEVDVVSLTNDEAGTVDPGTPVYIDANNGFKKARANAAGTKDVIGLAAASILTGVAGMIQTDGILTLTTGQWDTITGGSGGLTFNTRYYLDPATAGKLTTTAPTTVGQYVAPVGIAISTTSLEISIETDVLL